MCAVAGRLRFFALAGMIAAASCATHRTGAPTASAAIPTTGLVEAVSAALRTLALSDLCIPTCRRIELDSAIRVQPTFGAVDLTPLTVVGTLESTKEFERLWQRSVVRGSVAHREPGVLLIAASVLREGDSHFPARVVLTVRLPNGGIVIRGYEIRSTRRGLRAILRFDDES